MRLLIIHRKLTGSTCHSRPHRAAYSQSHVSEAYMRKGKGRPVPTSKISSALQATDFPQLPGRLTEQRTITTKQPSTSRSKSPETRQGRPIDTKIQYVKCSIVHRLPKSRQHRAWLTTADMNGRWPRLAYLVPASNLLRHSLKTSYVFEIQESLFEDSTVDGSKRVRRVGGCWHGRAKDKPNNLGKSIRTPLSCHTE